MRLRDYFRSEQIDSALSAYKENYTSQWAVATRLDMYNAAKVAFDADHSLSEREEVFRTGIYGPLKAYWKVFRGNSNHWDSEEAFHALSVECDECRKLSVVEIASCQRGEATFDTIQRCLEGFAGIKRNQSDYPWVAASKFLHFYNPRLFPVYDIKVVWKQVLNGAFKSDYISFCNRHGYCNDERSWLFNFMYSQLAAELMAEHVQDASSKLMPKFSAWFQNQIKDVDDSSRIQEEADTLYTTAFEFIAIGAASLEGHIAK